MVSVRYVFAFAPVATPPEVSGNVEAIVFPFHSSQLRFSSRSSNSGIEPSFVRTVPENNYDKWHFSRIVNSRIYPYVAR